MKKVPSMENAYIYTRVSTLIQVNGFSLEAHKQKLELLQKHARSISSENIRMKVNPARMPSIVLSLRR